jgi:hypothetical protein
MLPVSFGSSSKFENGTLSGSGKEDGRQKFPAFNLASCKAETPDCQLIASSVPKMGFFGTLDYQLFMQ